jgi:hypothetical protein
LTECKAAPKHCKVCFNKGTEEHKCLSVLRKNAVKMKNYKVLEAKADILE